MDAPVLETERLILRGHRVEDFAACAQLWADPVVTRFIGGTPQTSEEAWHRMLRYAGHWALMGFGYWVVEEKATGAFLGEVGFADLRRNLEPAISGIPEAGWILAPAAHGRGIAHEAVKAMHAWGKEHFTAQQSVCLVQPENAASLRLAGKMGYIETGRTVYRGKDWVILHREW